MTLTALLVAGRIGLGYLSAVAAATAVAVALMLAPTALPDDGERGSLFGMLEILPGMLVIGFFWTFLCALPGFLVAIVLAFMQQWRSWLPYALAGAINAYPSLLIFNGWGSGGGLPGMMMSCVPGGFAGGFAYWLAAGRYMARKFVPA